ncbi:Ldh family oxidoreductase [Candidatus Woesearchaeota archaeon]|nr:Ldh family oxidoreductase [Candidatus Woesearchaeota archaeon]
MKADIAELRKLCIKVLKKRGMTGEEAEAMIEEYFYGELSGKKSHGLSAFPKAVERLREPEGPWVIERESETYALIDGKGNPGSIIGKAAIELAILKAEERGIAIIGMHNMESYVMPGFYAHLAAKHGMIGWVMNNSRPRTAPYGGIDPRLGANPLGIGIPRKECPFVLDMATSERAMAEVRHAQKRGEQVQEGMALDADGEPTTDPHKVHSLVPFGSYKGYGISMAIEIMAAMVGGKTGSKVASDLDRGYLFIVIDPRIFTTEERFLEEIEELCSEIKSSRLARWAMEIRIPGERSGMLLKDALSSGMIEVDDRVVEEIERLTL